MRSGWPQGIKRSMRDHGNGVSVAVVSGRVQVRVPRTDEFVLVAHAFEGRWRKRSEVWSFPRANWMHVARELNRIYGTHINTEVT